MVANISITARYIYNPYIIRIVFYWYFVSATFMSFHYFLVEKLIFQIRLNSVFLVGREPLVLNVLDQILK